MGGKGCFAICDRKELGEKKKKKGKRGGGRFARFLNQGVRSRRLKKGRRKRKTKTMSGVS